jgi:hypothetical protein
MAFEVAATDGKTEVTLSQIGTAIKKINPKFKTKRYGCKTLGAIFDKLEDYDLVPTIANSAISSNSSMERPF